MSDESPEHLPDSQFFHNRATESAKETRQGIVTMSSASLAVFFLALTSKIEPALNSRQKAFMLVALISMAMATFCGLWSAHSDARWSYCWAKERSIPVKPEEKWQEKSKRWHAQKRWSEKAAGIAFAVGVFFSAIYIALRAFTDV